MIHDLVLIELIVGSCRRAERAYRQFAGRDGKGNRGGDVLSQVYLTVSRAVTKKPEVRGNEKYVRVASERQAHREYRRLLRDRLPQFDPETSR